MAVLTVDDDRAQIPAAEYTSIQEAIDAASPGDTVWVAAGVYNEAINIDKALTLIGAGANICPVDGGRPDGESVINGGEYPVQITASDVVFNGFEVKDFRYGVFLPGTAFTGPEYTLENITIDFNWIHSDNAWVGIVSEPGVLRNYSITNNIVRVNNISPGGDPYAIAAICFNGLHGTPTYENVVVKGNEIVNLSGEYGLYSEVDPADYLINTMTISCNRFINVPDGSNFNIGNIRNGEFVNNLVENTFGTIGIDTGAITGNTFRNGGYLRLWGTDFGFTRPSANLRIQNNDFTGEIFGRALRVRTGCLSDTIHVNYNSIRNSGIPAAAPLDPATGGILISNEGLGTLDAARNHWGGHDGPAGNSGSLYGQITVSPWITSYIDQPFEKTRSDCCALIGALRRRPGFWPVTVGGVSYIGRTRFRPDECAALVAQVDYTGGEGEGIPVTFAIDGCSYHSRTATGGVAYLCLGRTCPGAYTLTVSAGEFSASAEITVGPECFEPDAT